MASLDSFAIIDINVSKFTTNNKLLLLLPTPPLGLVTSAYKAMVLIKRDPSDPQTTTVITVTKMNTHGVYECQYIVLGGRAPTEPRLLYK